MDALETEIKILIVEALKLEDLVPGAIASDEPLFVDGLGLDSIDALELGVALRKRILPMCAVWRNSSAASRESVDDTIAGRDS